MSIAKSSQIKFDCFFLFYSIRINDQWRIVFKFENVVAENVRIADINIRLIDYHKTDITLLLAALVRKNCTFSYPCECSPKLHCEVAIHLAMPLQPTNLATFGGRCIQLAMPRTHSDPGSAQLTQYACLYGFSGFGERTTKSDSTSSFKSTSSK